MNRLTIGSIITATILLVGCGGGGSSSTSSNDSSTSNNGRVNKKVGIGYYVDSAVEGVNYQCGNENGTTDENGTFIFESGSDCSFTLGSIKLRDINASLLEDNITILETNETVAQLLQTLDSDGNASNGIQIPKGADTIVDETIPSLDDLNQDILEVVHDRLKAEHSDEYNGIVVDRNKTIEHLNETRANLEARHIRTNLDIEAEHRANHNNNSINYENSHNMDSNNITQDRNETINNNFHMDNNESRREVMNNEHRDSNITHEQEYSNNNSTQTTSSVSSNSQEQEHSGSSSFESNGEGSGSNSSSNDNSESSNHTSLRGSVRG